MTSEQLLALASRPGEYVEMRLREGGLRLVSGSPTMLQDEFEHLDQELRAAANMEGDRNA